MGFSVNVGRLQDVHAQMTAVVISRVKNVILKF